VHSYAGEYPGEWDHAGRERMFNVVSVLNHRGSELRVSCLSVSMLVRVGARFESSRAHLQGTVQPSFKRAQVWVGSMLAS
jgi:hypothetical protein